MTRFDKVRSVALFVGALVFFGYLGFKLLASPAVLTGEASGACQIKGNINLQSGKHVYYLPGQKDYLRIGISKGNGERWFCSEAEALAAGWSRSPQ